ncbi:hypothetical protein BHE74_00014330 [Ensete ventricosum]|nr:hypothetical protein BHE74_00014330 [Ensete ventricosum]
MKRWKTWEEETTTLEHQLSNDPRRLKLARQTSFGERHLKSWSNHHLFLWMVHFSRDCKFEFRKFLRRSVDRDFAVVVGISWHSSRGHGWVGGHDQCYSTLLYFELLMSMIMLQYNFGLRSCFHREVADFKYPSGRLELLEVQRVVEEIIQHGANNTMPNDGELSFGLWRRPIN